MGDMQLLEDTRTLFKMRSMLLQRLYDKISTITWKMCFAAAAHTMCERLTLHTKRNSVVTTQGQRRTRLAAPALRQANKHKRGQRNT